MVMFETTNTKEQFDAVVEFMTVAGQKVNTTFVEPTTKVGNFRLSLIKEEMAGKNELFDSIEKDDLKGILDGICDVLYVAYGALATFGIEPAIYEIPKRSKSTLLRLSVANTMMKHINDSYEKTTRGLLMGDLRTIQSGLNSLIYSTIDLALQHGFDLPGAFKEVHASNMAKFCKSAHECAKSIAQRQEEKPEDYIGAEGFEVQVNDTSYFVIRRAKDGKVLKGLDFFEPDLQKFINV
jgi:predicted HAD superfamily Cof-like phosphohydrolase